ncbi:MAG TPA: hypothetical protein VF144_06980 [Chitinophagaceae bacterium]
MNNVLSIFIALFFASCNNPGTKYFTGTIEYAYTYSSDSLNADSLANTRASRGLFRYDTINYQGKFIGADTIEHYYSGQFNKALSRSGSLGNYECEDYGSFTDSVISYKLIDTDEKILGYRCRILEIQKKNSWLQYYVSNDLKLAPGTYRRHSSYNWDYYGEKANGSLILRSEHRLKYFTMKGIATSINKSNIHFKALEIDEKLFAQYCK